MSTILITGASSGIGKRSAELFSECGWNVIAAIRNPQKAKELEALHNVTIVQLDITDSEQIAAVASELIANYDIDVLFNNAGSGAKCPLEAVTEEEIHRIFQVDTIGPMLLTQKFIPYFKQKRSGLILTTTSLAGIIGLPLDGIYGAAKRATTSMCESIYYELKPFNVAVKILIPGATKTNFSMSPYNIEGYEHYQRNQRTYLLDGGDSFATSDEVAEVVWTAVTDGQDKIHYVGDTVTQKLYDQYQQLGVERFKNWFYEYLNQN